MMNKHAESSINHSAFNRGVSVAFHLEDGVVLLYKKGRKDSLTQKEKNLLKEVSRSIKREYDNER